MTSLPAPKESKALYVLVFIHLIIIALSNYLVQIPVEVIGFQTTWGAFTFPLIFLATDLTVRIFGQNLARKIILTAMLPALALSYILSVLFYEGVFQGLSGLVELNTFVARIALASFVAYVIGQLLDVGVFSFFRKNHSWWVAPAMSTVIGGLIDTILFFSIAFYKSTDEFMASNWPEIAAVDYVFKLLISLALFVPAYGAMMSYFSSRYSENLAWKTLE